MPDQINTAHWITWFITSLPWIIGGVFFVAAFTRYIIFYTVQRHEWFSVEFEKRVNRFVESQNPGDVNDVSFYVLSKKWLEKTYYEIFELRDRMQRRRSDKVMRLADRVFLIKQGCAWLVKDILKQ